MTDSGLLSCASHPSPSGTAISPPFSQMKGSALYQSWPGEVDARLAGVRRCEVLGRGHVVVERLRCGAVTICRVGEHDTGTRVQRRRRRTRRRTTRPRRSREEDRRRRARRRSPEMSRKAPTDVNAGAWVLPNSTTSGAVGAGQTGGELVDETVPALLLDDEGRAGVLLLERLLQVVTSLLGRVGTDQPDSDLRAFCHCLRLLRCRPRSLRGRAPRRRRAPGLRASCSWCLPSCFSWWFRGPGDPSGGG